MYNRLIFAVLGSIVVTNYSPFLIAMIVSLPLGNDRRKINLRYIPLIRLVSFRTKIVSFWTLQQFKLKLL